MFLRLSSERTGEAMSAAVRLLRFTRNIALMMILASVVITFINADPNHAYTLSLLSTLRDWSRAAFNL